MELFIQGPAGRLEALYDSPTGSGEPRAVAALGHPHPQFGGTMRNTVVFRTARALRRAGLAVLRINFRGVEASEGQHDGEGAEELDLAAALDWLAERHPGAALWAGGYSFGCCTAAALALREPRIEGLVGVAPPVLRLSCAGLDQLTQPTLLVFAGRDEFGTRAALHERWGVFGPNYELVEIPETDHFFRHRTPQLEEAVHHWALGALEGRS